MSSLQAAINLVLSRVFVAQQGVFHDVWVMAEPYQFDMSIMTLIQTNMNANRQKQDQFNKKKQ